MSSRLCAFITALCVVLVMCLLLFMIGPETLVDVTVQDATLTRFDVDPTLNVLYFNLSAHIRVHNPNEVDAYSNDIASALYYNPGNIGSSLHHKGYYLDHIRIAPPMIYLRRKDTAVVTAAFTGRADEFDSSSCPTGISYSFDVWISYHFRPNSTKKHFKSGRRTMNCGLDLRLVANETLKTMIGCDHTCGSMNPKYWPSDLPFH